MLGTVSYWLSSGDYILTYWSFSGTKNGEQIAQCDKEESWQTFTCRFTWNRLVGTSGRNRVKLFFWGGGPYPGADTGFPEGGGGEDIHKHTPPWTLSAWRHPPTPPLLDIHKHPPPWTLPVWRHPHSKGGGWSVPVSRTLCIGFQYRYKFKGGVIIPVPPWIRHCYPKQKSWAKQRPSARPHHNALLTSKSYYNVS